jgi:tRNA threonylcarbamoyladenosine biosynthesis protein TsaE
MADLYSIHTKEVISVVDLIAAHISEIPILLLKGELGTGKTTLAKALCNRLGYDGEVTSPTYAIINEYLTNDGRIIFHMDLYRIQHLEELQDLGFIEYIESGQYCIIEWPEIAEGLIEALYLTCEIHHRSEGRQYYVSNNLTT